MECGCECANAYCCSQNGVVSLIDCTLLEDPEGTDDECKNHNVSFLPH